MSKGKARRCAKGKDNQVDFTNSHHFGKKLLLLISMAIKNKTCVCGLVICS